MGRQPKFFKIMKNKNLRNALDKFNQFQEANASYEILNPDQAGAIKGGLAACPCRRGALTCSQTFSAG